MKYIFTVFILFFTISTNAQVGIGTSTPDASAQLDISSSSKGFLPPRVALTATNSASPVTSPATGLLVYNTATAGSSPNNASPGFYYWSGTAWMRLIIPTDNAANVTGTVAVANGGTGAATLTANNVLLGNGTSPLQAVAPGATGNVLTSNGTTWTSAGTHTIGESYGGGIVFYVYDNGKHGLIAATSDQSTAMRWYGGSYTNTRARANGVGAGLKNTAISIATQVAVDGYEFAATVCNEYSVTVDGVTYGDWYLPSMHELNLLYSQRTVVGGFTGNYWSSSEYSSGFAWYKDFLFGNELYQVKSHTFYVRAIRAF